MLLGKLGEGDGGDCVEMIRDKCPPGFRVRMVKSQTSTQGEQPLSIKAARQSAHRLQTDGFVRSHMGGSR